ncbi:MAG: 2-polyprenyl-6-methoxyphenol hydroxylase-like oxidoreductase [Cyanobacteria bacterium P01_A01_bin.17]
MPQAKRQHQTQALHPESAHAIVIGGSIAGLLAARMLTDHFERVTIVERDPLPSEPKARPGVPQSQHTHILLTQGYHSLETLFPGIGDSLVAQGATRIDWLAECPIMFPSGWAPRFPSEIKAPLCSRTLLEQVIRQQLERNDRIRWATPCTVTQFIHHPQRAALRAVQLKDAHGKTTELSAQLIVDASGRNSHAPQWLQHLGYAPPQETIIDSGLGYASRWYRRPREFSEDWKSIYVMAQAPNYPCLGALFQLEDDRWLVTLMGINHNYPPTNDAGFLDFASHLRSSVIYEAIKTAEPLSEIYSYRGTANRQRHYEKLTQLPENFISIGDATCAFNPVYGQGVTIAAESAIILGQCLQHQHERYGAGQWTGFSQYFHQQLVSVTRTPWLMATGEDLRWPQTVGNQPDLMTRLMQWYMDQVISLINEDGDVYQAFLEVIHRLKAPTSLLHPQILKKVLAKRISHPSGEVSTSSVPGQL